MGRIGQSTKEMTQEEINNIVLTTDPKAKKLHFSRTQKIVDWLKERKICFDDYKDTVTVYCHTNTEIALVRKELERLYNS